MLFGAGVMSERSVLAAFSAEGTSFAGVAEFHNPKPSGRSIQEVDAAGIAQTSAPPLQPTEAVAQNLPRLRKILSSFNTWAFKREQPDSPESMLRFIADSAARAVPLSFILYWGKGPRCRIGQPDIECLDNLGRLVQRIREAYEPGAAIKLIFTDTHAELNGHSWETTRRYFAEIEGAAGQRGFDTCWLSAVTAAAGLAPPSFSADEVPAEMLMLLSASAQKWYRGDGTYNDGAAKYYRMNLVERRAVELAFPRSIFITFNGSNLRPLFPERLPIFYMYSLRRGVGIKPWFLPAEVALCSDLVCRCASDLENPLAETFSKDALRSGE